MTKTTRRNIEERITNMMNERNIELKDFGYGDQGYKVTKEQFNDVVEFVFSNLGADLKDLEVWEHKKLKHLCIRTTYRIYGRFVIV